MRKTLVLSSALALLMATGAAYAGSSNTLYIDQEGGTNSANVQQSAGPGGNDIGSPASPFLQDGTGNSFTETQATGGGFSRGDNDIIKAKQVGDNNRFSDYYSNNAGGNRVNNFTQDGDSNVASVSRNASISGTVGTLTEDGDKNFLSISQNGTGNTVTKATITGSNNGWSTQNAGNWGTLLIQSGDGNIIAESSVDGSDNNTAYGTTNDS
jgi:hypothetical protein